MTRLYVVAYDTPSNRRRRRLAEVLQGYGQRVQDSVLLVSPKDNADIIYSGVGPPPSEPEVPIV